MSPCRSAPSGWFCGLVVPPTLGRVHFYHHRRLNFTCSPMETVGKRASQITLGTYNVLARHVTIQSGSARRRSRSRRTTCQPGTWRSSRGARVADHVQRARQARDDPVGERASQITLKTYNVPARHVAIQSGSARHRSRSR